MVDQNMNARLSDFLTERMLVSHWDRPLEDGVAREAIESDLAALLTPTVLEHLPPSFAFNSDDASETGAWINARDEEAQVYIVRSTIALNLLGLLFLTGGITEQDEDNESAYAVTGAGEDDTDSSTLRIGYLFGQSTWGKGYATELIEGLMSNLDEIGRPLVRASVSTDNGASARVLIKSGFSLVEELSERDMEIYEA